MNQTTIEEKITRLNIHHTEKRIRLELENLNELKGLNCVATYDRNLLKDKCNSTIDIIKDHWMTYEKLPGVDTKAKIQFLALHHQLIDLLGILGIKL
jgi:hypothetical protein